MKDRTLLMIPGPIEFAPEVMQAFGAPTTSHVAPNFIEVFGKSLELMREVWMSPSGQPFIVAGSGTLAMDIAGANLTEPGDKVLVVSTGYFGERFAELLKRYGADVTVLNSTIGDVVDINKIEETLKKDSYKILTFTHVDTSTAVFVEPKAIAQLCKKYNVLSILDGVCSVAGEEIRQDEWGIDVVLTASQKAVGVPPGLALVMASPNAIKKWKERKTPVGNYYADWRNWLPIMQAYEARKPSYFGTPPMNLIYALHASLKQIVAEGMDARILRHKKFSNVFKEAIKALGLKQLPVKPEYCASTLTAAYYPDGVNAGDFLLKVKQGGAIIAGGLYPSVKDIYFRVGHMGVVNSADVLAVVSAIENGLKGCGYKFETGIGVATAQRLLV